jgi:hypothetical protein
MQTKLNIFNNSPTKAEIVCQHARRHCLKYDGVVVHRRVVQMISVRGVLQNIKN